MQLKEKAIFKNLKLGTKMILGFSAVAVRKAKEVNPEQVIPMDKDDFKDF